MLLPCARHLYTSLYDFLSTGYVHCYLLKADPFLEKSSEFRHFPLFLQFVLVVSSIRHNKHSVYTVHGYLAVCVAVPSCELCTISCQGSLLEASWYTTFWSTRNIRLAVSSYAFIGHSYQGHVIVCVLDFHKPISI